MKSVFSFIGILAAGVLSLTNCKPAEIEPEFIPVGEPVKFTVTSGQTRTVNEGLHTLWASGDALNVMFGVPDSTYGSAGKATIEDGAGTGWALFSMSGGTVPSGELNWYVLYPYNSANSTPNKVQVKIGAENVTQNGYDNPSHLSGGYCPLYGTAKKISLNQASIAMHQLSSAVEFRVSNNCGIPVKVKSIQLNATEIAAGSFVVDLIGAEPAFVSASGSKSPMVTVSNPASLANGSTAKVYLPIKPYTHDTTSKLVVTAMMEIEGKTIEVPFNLNVNSSNATFSAGRIKPVTLKLTSDMVYGSMSITSVEAKCHKADVTGQAAAVGTSVIQWRKSGASSWQSASSSVTGSNVKATITGLDQNTSYEVRVTSGSASGPSKSFSTKKEGAQLYNMGFDDWYTKSNVQYCYSSSATSAQKAIWASANENTYTYTKVNGAASEGSFLAVSGSGKHALKLTSQLVEVKVLGVTIAKQFAAGSLFTGSVGSINVSTMSATINMGVSFTDRPDAFELYACYKPKTIDFTSDDHTNMKGKTDTGHVFVLLTDWSGPFAVTPPSKVIDFDKDSGIIGMGKIEFKSTMSGYQKYTVNIDYRSDRTPKYVVICGASSAMGDYFTGGIGSVLYLDEMKFIYE